MLKIIKINDFVAFSFQKYTISLLLVILCILTISANNDYESIFYIMEIIISVLMRTDFRF